MNSFVFPDAHRILGIMCDLDGTLVDSRRDLTTAVNCMRADFDLSPLSFEEVTSFIGNGAEKLVERSLRNTEIESANALKHFKTHYTAHLADETCCYPGVPETLKIITSRSIRCAVITNKPEEPARQVLRHTGLAEYFDPVVGGDTNPALKPNPYSLRHVMNQWQLEPSQVLMIGDHTTDIAAAHAAGVKSVFLKSGYGFSGEFQPDITLESFSELAVLLGIH